MEDSPKNGKEGANGESNIVQMPTLAQRDRIRREEKKELEKKERGPQEPLINLPPATKILLGLLIAVHVLVHLALPPQILEWVFLHLAFIPGRFTGAAPFELLALVTPLTHMALHGSWLHIGMNSVMLMAFGSGVERWMGAKRMVLFFLLCGLFGIAAHFILTPFSPYPVVGASGGLSGLFAAALVMINKSRSNIGGRFGIMPFVLLWIGISVLFGMMGSPDGSSIAWAAHVGGFLGGFVILKFMKL